MPADFNLIFHRLKAILASYEEDLELTKSTDQVAKKIQALCALPVESTGKGFELYRTKGWV